MQVSSSRARAGKSVILLVACLICAFTTLAKAFDISGLTLRLEPRASTVREGDNIDMTVVFTGGALETTLILPMGADPSGIISFRVTDVASGKEWTGGRSDPRSFAADGRRNLAAGGRLELHYQSLQIIGDKLQFWEAIPPGTYRFVVTYDEARTFRPESRGPRMLRSEPVEIVVTPR